MATIDTEKSTLEMVFTTDIPNKTATITIANPKDDLTADEVENVMNLIIDKNIFVVSGGATINGIKSYFYRQVVTTSLPTA